MFPAWRQVEVQEEEEQVRQGKGRGWHANWRQRRVVRELLKNVQHASVSFFVPPRIYSYF